MGIIYDFFGMILNLIFEGVSMFAPMATLGITIIIFTLVTRLLLTPLQLTQQRTSRAMNRVQPEMRRIQEKYKNRKDQASQLAYSQELQTLYKKHKIKPTAGCLPMLIQFPLIIALYAVLRTPISYIDKLGSLYGNIATTITQNVANYASLLTDQIQVVSTYNPGTYNLATIHGVDGSYGLADLLSHFTTAQWTEFLTKIPESAQTSLTTLLDQKNNFEWFLGINLVDSPANLVHQGMWIALLVPIIAGASTFIFSKITMAATSPQGSGSESADQMMKTMNIMMPIMTGFFSYNVPCGLALYWIAGNIIMMGQQKWVNHIVSKEEAVHRAKMEEEAAAKRAARKAAGQGKPKKKRPKPPVEGNTVGVEGETTERPAKKKKPRPVAEDGQGDKATTPKKKQPSARPNLDKSSESKTSDQEQSDK